VFSKLIYRAKDVKNLGMSERALWDYRKRSHSEQYRHEFHDDGEPIYLELKGIVYSDAPKLCRTSEGVQEMILTVIDDEGLFDEFRQVVEQQVQMTEGDVFDAYFFKKMPLGSWVYMSCDTLMDVCYPEIIRKCVTNAEFKILIIPYAVETVSKIGVSRWVLKYRLFSFELIK